MSIGKLVESPKATRKSLIDKPKTEQTPKKRVRFHGTVKRRFFDRVEDEDREKVWYTSAEAAHFRKFEDALRDCVSADKVFYFQNKEDFNAQGVITHDQATKKYAKIDASIDAVLRAQEEQESNFFDDNSVSGELFALNDEKIAEVYRCHAYEALEQAQCRASRHERHLKEIEDEPTEQNSSSSPSPITRLSPRSKKSIIVRRQQLPVPSVFVPEESSQVVECIA